MFGQLDELVQAGGGNISVKIEGKVTIIKSSGVALCDVTKDRGYCIVNHEAIANSLSGLEEPNLKDMTFSSGVPSLEVYFHSFMKKYVVHIHPSTMLPYLCGSCPEAVPYFKPGFELSKEVYTRWKGEPVVFLKNHGVIFTSDSLNELIAVANSTYETFRRPGYVPIDVFWKFQDTYPDQYIYKVSIAETAAYMPILIKHNIRKLTPDTTLFLYDSVIVEDGYLFIRGSTKQNCIAVLEVLRSYCESVEDCASALTEMRAAAILHWPAEKFRKSIGP
jgi:rhamnose utilization protein RhaD (predicted bifunctional aldolase and dehydrogenase)